MSLFWESFHENIPPSLPPQAPPQAPPRFIQGSQTWGSWTRRGSNVLSERSGNIGSDTASIGSRQSIKSIGSIRSAVSRHSIYSVKSNLSQASKTSRTSNISWTSNLSRASNLSRVSQLSIKSIITYRSSKSFRSLGTYASSGSSQGGRSQSAYGESPQAIYDWDDGWETSQYPRPESAHTEIRTIPVLYRVPAEFIQPPFVEASAENPADVTRLRKVIRAAKHGNDHLLDFLVSSSLADPDPPPIRHDAVAFSTPVLAAIGQKNIKVIEVLLRQKGFNPTRQFQGITYYEIAERRQGPVWKDEVRILKQAYDNYVARYWSCASGQINQSNTVPLANTANTTASASVSRDVPVTFNPWKPTQTKRPGLAGQPYKFKCDLCGIGFLGNYDRERHQRICRAARLRDALGHTARGLRLRQGHVQLPIRTTSNAQLTKLRMPIDSKCDSTSDMSATSGLQARTENQGHENARTTCIRCSTHNTSLWRRDPEGQPLCNLCWVYLNVHKVPRPLNQNANIAEKRHRANTSSGRTSETTQLTDDNLYEDLSQLSKNQSTPEPMEYEQSDLPGTNSTSGLGSPNESMFSSPRRNSEITSACTTPSQGESEASSSSMNEGSEDGVDEDENVYIRRAEKKRALLRDLMDIVYLSYNRFVASGTTDEGEPGTSSAPRESPTAEQSSGDQRKISGDLKGKRRLLRGDEDNGSEGNDDGQQPKRAKSGGDTDGLDQAKKFACPYYQRSLHRRHADTNLPRRACYGPGFLTVRRVKEHLYRAHRLPLVCPRCDTQIDSEFSLENHMRQDPPCVTRPKQSREGVDSTTEKLLRSRNKDFNKKTEADKWRHVYTVIFPADNPRDLPSPYHESHIAANFADSLHLNSTAKRYEEFLQRELCPRIYRVLESRIDEALESAERDATDTLKSQLQGIFRDVQAELYDEFHAAVGTANEAAPIIPVETTADIPAPELCPILPDSWSLPEPWSALVMDDRPAALNSSIYPFPNEFEGISNIDFDFDFLTGLAGAENHHNLEVPATAVPFKVKAIYDYTSDHAEDLSFGIGQIITVTDEEDSNWYGGEYVDDCGIKKEGIFPQNLVESYKPPTPPRPTRSRREDTNVAQLP